MLLSAWKQAKYDRHITIPIFLTSYTLLPHVTVHGHHVIFLKRYALHKSLIVLNFKKVMDCHWLLT